jgi:signal peptidase
MSEDSRNWVGPMTNVLVLLVLVAAVSPFVVYAVPETVGADHGLVVLSGSMEPAMSPGDAVIVRESSPADIEEQDIITYQTSSETPTTHRVIEIQQTDNGVAYVTKGDANEEADRQPVPQSRVVGEVAFVIPYIGHVIQFANTQVGFLVLVLTPMALFVISELWELSKSLRSGSSGDETQHSGTDDDSPGPNPTPAPDATNAAAAGTDDEESTGGGFTLTRSSLKLIGLLFMVYVPYSAYVAYTTPEAWSIAVATGSAIGFLFCVVMLVATRGGGGTDSTTSSTAAGVVGKGTLPDQVEERATVTRESVESLIQMAVDRDDRVIYDDEQDTYFLSQDDEIYLHRSAPEPDGGTPVAEEAPETADPDANEQAADVEANNRATDGEPT